MHMMQSKAFQDYLNQYGRAPRLASELGLTRQAVNLWRYAGIPPLRVLQVERITGIPRSQLRPDLYPPEETAA